MPTRISALHPPLHPKVADGALIRLDSYAGVLEARVPAEAWQRRDVPMPDLSAAAAGSGRELFAAFRAAATGAEEGAVACMR
jgi:phosphogluconate dehydratase